MELEEQLITAMTYTFREYREVKPLSEEKIKELAKEIHENKVTIVTSENIHQLPMATFLISAFVEESDF